MGGLVFKNNSFDSQKFRTLVTSHGCVQLSVSSVKNLFSKLSTRSLLTDVLASIHPFHLVSALIVARYSYYTIAFSEVKALFVLVTFLNILW